MTTAILITSTQELGVALAALRSGLLPVDDHCLLVSSTTEAAEVDHPVLDTAIAVARAEGLPVVHLNELIAPRHPLGWRVADLTPEEFAQAWQRQTGLPSLTAVAPVGRKRNPAVTTLRRVTGADPVTITYSPEHLAAVLLRRGQAALVVDAPVGAAAIAALSRGRIRLIGPAQVRAARDTIRRFDSDIDQVPWLTTIPRWWGRLLRSVLHGRRRRTQSPPALPRRATEDAAERAQKSIEFTRRMIADVDGASAARDADQ